MSNPAISEPLEHVIDVLAEKHGNEDAVTFGRTRLSFRDVRDRTYRVAQQLTQDGVRPGEMVGVSAQNEIHHFILTLALLRVGATQVTLASHDPQDIVSDLTRRTKCHRVLGDRDVFDSWNTKHPSGILTESGVTSARASLLLKTSGTVARAKLVPLSWDSLLLQARQHEFYTNSRFMRYASIEHNNSKRHRLYCFLQGGTNVFRSTSAHGLTKKDLARSSSSRVDIARSHFSSLLTSREAFHLPAEISITVAGSPLPSSLRAAFQETVTESLFVRYGSTETGTISIAGPQDHTVEGAVGKPLPGVVLDIDAELAPIRIKTPGMSTAYFDATPEQSASFDQDWFVPGDLGLLSAHGHLIIVGRNGEAFTLDGVNIFPREIESMLVTHPAILEAVVVKKESAFHDGIPIAFARLSPRASVSEIELLNWSREKMGLAGPRQILFVDQFPTTDQGKIDLRALRDASQ